MTEPININTAKEKERKAEEDYYRDIIRIRKLVYTLSVEAGFTEDQAFESCAWHEQ